MIKFIWAVTIPFIVAIALYLPMGTVVAQSTNGQEAQLVGSKISIQSVNFKNLHLVARVDGSAVDLAGELNERADFTLQPGLTDTTMVSLQVNDGTDRFIVATANGVVLQGQADIADLSQATFQQVAGLAGSGVSFESLAQPNFYLRHSSYVLRLDEFVDVPLFRADSSFSLVAPLGPAGRSICSENAAEAADYALVYHLEIPEKSNYDASLLSYTVNASANITSYDRVGYCMQLDEQWVWVSMDDFTNGTITQTGVPVVGVNPNGFQEIVTNLKVASNVDGVSTGNNFATGNIEFWHQCYETKPYLELPGASNQLYDYDDELSPNTNCAGYGSMQVHNFGAQQTVFALNAWDEDGTENNEMGIGTNPNRKQHPDWTFTHNAADYTTRNLWVYVRQPNERAAPLTIAPPTALPGLIANIEETFQPQVAYNGYNQLSFSLLESPAGMTIDLSSGLIRWTPQEADEGQEHPVTVRVTDGHLFQETAFAVTVLQPRPLEVAIEGDTLSVIDETSSLNGMTITQLDGEPMLDQLQLGVLDTAAAPPQPAWVAPLSDVFVVKGSFAQEFELRYPLEALPADVSLAAVDLYAFTGALDVEGRLWSPVWMGIDYEETAAAPTIAVTLGGLEGMAHWGYDAAEATQVATVQPMPSQREAARIGLAAPVPQASTVTCTQQSVGGTPVTHLCKTSDVTITIRGWLTETLKWGGATPQVSREQFVGWLIDAQADFIASGLGFDNSFNVDVHSIQEPDPRYITLGYVSSVENRKTLHINNKNSISVAWIKGTAVHEYFHHAQGHPATKIGNEGLLIDSWPDKKWLIEGTARWFEDQVFDDDNAYLSDVGARIAEAGMNSASGDGIKWPYARFTFFKMVNERCSTFVSNYKYAVNVADLQTDRSGVKNFVARLGDGDGTFGCNFGNHFGADNASSLAAALAYYNYATQLEGKVSLLDTNEVKTDGSDLGFRFDKPEYQFVNQPASVDALVATPGQAITLTMATSIPPAGAYSFHVPLTGTLPAGKVAELKIEGSKGITVSIIGSGSEFTGTIGLAAAPAPRSHAWFNTAKRNSFVYGSNGTVPELFVTLINPRLTEQVDNVKVTLRVRNELTATADITSHANGDQVSNRVITIIGTIPSAVREATTSVRVSVNGIAFDTPMSDDGSFTIQAVMAMGDNIITVEGMGANGQTTLANVVTLQGVAATEDAQRNALIPSRVVFVLRWSTDDNDVDIYLTDKRPKTLWYGNIEDTTLRPGSLDFDERYGYGPEVVSYRVTDEDVYVNGTFDVDVHYYDNHEVTVPTNFTVDVVLNETGGGERRSYQYRSVKPLVVANGEEQGPEGTGDSRFNDVLRVTCDAQRICTIASVNAEFLTDNNSPAQ